MMIGFACLVKILIAVGADSLDVLFVLIMPSEILKETANVSKDIIQTMENAQNARLLAQHALLPQIVIINACRTKIQEACLMMGAHVCLGFMKMV